jgi:hypothetical protein
MIKAMYKDDLNLISLHQKIVKHLSGAALDAFETETRELLTVYRDHLAPKTRNTTAVVFGMKPSSLSVSQKQLTPAERQVLQQRSVVIARYLRLANKHLPSGTLEVTKTNNPSLRTCCSDCGGTTVEEGDGCMVCEMCGLGEYPSTLSGGSESTQSGGGNSGKKNNTDTDGILEAMLLFQGKQRKTPPKECIDKIQEYCDSRGITSRLNLFSLHSILEELNLKGHYTHINYIWSKVTKKPCPDIHEYEDAILSRYQTIYRDASHLIQSDKGSFPRDIMLLRTLLLAEGVNVSESFFPEVKTSAVREAYNATMKSCFAYLKQLHKDQKWIYVPI